jgi:hypothetical protein
MAEEMKYPERVEVIENTLGITVDGKTFSHMRRKWAYEIHQIYLSNGNELRCTATHRIKLKDGTFIFAKDVIRGTEFSTGLYAQDVFVNPYDGWVYDLVEIEDHEFNTHGVVSHNCEFLSSDALLINSMRLAQLRYQKPIFESLGFKFWVPEEELGGRNKIYLVSMDPSTGSGRDFTSIEIFDFPGLTQVAEYRSNDVNIPLIYAKLTWVLRKLTEHKNGGRSEVLWTFERNGIGEAVSALYYNDENQIETAELVSDHPAKFGVFTTGRQKVLSALQLKNLVEKVGSKGIEIRSEDLIHELKHFVSKGQGYEAKVGCTDDSVMATLGIMRLLKRLSEYNEEAFQRVNEYVDPDASMDETNDAVPFAIL